MNISKEAKTNDRYKIKKDIVDGVEYHDTVDINSVKLCELMKQGGKVSTSTPTIGEIEDYFEDDSIKVAKNTEDSTERSDDN